MPWWAWIVVIGAGVALIVLILRAWSLASRIDRLHRRVVTRRGAAARQLVRRSGEVRSLALAGKDALPPEVAAQLLSLADAALQLSDNPLAPDGLDAPGATKPDPKSVEQRLRAESKLSQYLRSSLTPELRTDLVANPVPAAQLDAVDQASYRVTIVRTLHNQDVKQTLVLRQKPLAVALRLAGRAPMPLFVDFDDTAN